MPTLSNRSHKITPDSISTFVLGTTVNTVKSTYVNTPVFHLSLLEDEGMLDLNLQSASQDDLDISIQSNKSAASSSIKFNVETKASLNICGVFGAAAGAKFEYSSAGATSDGQIYVTMSRGKSGSYYEINATDLKSGLNFTPYIIGQEISDTQLSEYITLHYDSDGGFIRDISFGGVEESGLAPWADRNYYGNIQLLTEMQTVFAQLLQQYRDLHSDPEKRNILLLNMRIVRSKIARTVKEFYAHVGTHFVSKLNFSNSAYGFGVLNFSESSSNEEWGVGLSLSLKGSYSAASFGAGGEFGTDVGYARKNGSASAMKDLHIEAQSRPSGVVDLSSFASEIAKMLSSEDQPLSVPQLSIPSTPKVELKHTEDCKKKKKATPPGSVFKSLQEWEDYQKKGKGGVEETAKRVDKEIRERGVVELTTEEVDQEGPEKEKEEIIINIDSLPPMHDKACALADSVSSTSNILRVDDMIVSSFETTSYDTVIPALRISGIIIPDDEVSSETYPNVTKLVLAVNAFRQASQYLIFLSNFSVSNITPGIAAAFERFHDDLSESSSTLINQFMTQGMDLPSKNLTSFARSWYGEKDSHLLKYLYQDPDLFAYIMYLLDPKIMPLWADAPGGYAPLTLEKGKVKFCIWDSIDRFGCLNVDLSKEVTDTIYDFTKLYDGLTQTPLYPVLRYEHSSEPKLVFLQLIGRYQVVYGQNTVVLPYIFPSTLENLVVGNLGRTSLKENTFSRPIDLYSSPGHRTLSGLDLIPEVTDDIMAPLLEKVQGFDLDRISSDHALLFERKTQTSFLHRSNRLVSINLKDVHDLDWPLSEQPLTKHGEFTETLTDGGRVNKKTAYCGYFCPELQAGGMAKLLYFRNAGAVRTNPGGPLGGSLVRIDDGTTVSFDQSISFPLLYPIGYDNVPDGYGSLPMGSSFGLNDILASNTYEIGLSTSLLS